MLEMAIEGAALFATRVYMKYILESLREPAVWGLFMPVLAEHSKSSPRWGEFLNAVLITVLAVRLACYSGGHQGLIAHLATSKERDGAGRRDHPWAVNVVHNLLDFLADHPHTNDRV